MQSRWQWRFDMVVGAFLLAGLVLALCILSFDPADPPSSTTYPPHAVATNLLGWPGALLARRLLDALGVAVYVFLAAWFVLVLALLLRRPRIKWIVRVSGWFIAVPTVAVLADAVQARWSGWAPSGAGGDLGAWLNLWLRDRYTGIALASIYAGGIILTLGLVANDVILAILGQIGRITRWMRAARHLGAGSLASRPKPTVAKRPRRRPVAAVEAESNEPKYDAPLPVAAMVGAAAPSDDIPIRYPSMMEAAGPEDDASDDAAVNPVAVTRVTGPDEPPDARFADFELPPLTLLDDPEPFPYEEQDQRLRDRALVLEKTFTDFGLNVRVVGINTGPVITQYEVALETGLRVHKVTRLADDLALNLKVPSVRVVAPIPGKNTVGIEIPNEHRAVVRLKEVLLTASSQCGRMKIPLFLGKDTEGRPLVQDLAEMPHLLIAGRTGTGKSVCMNAIIISMLMTRRPDEIKMVMIDPKMLELSEYGKIPHLMHPVVKDMKKAEAILSWAVDKMEERYDLLSRARVRSIAAYNELSPEEIRRRIGEVDEEERARIPDRMPYIVIFVDEMNDLMMVLKKEVEGHIIRLAQKSRAAGIHLVVATQKPTVDVITGLIKSNLPARICFQVSSRSDSRVVLDEMGADKLLGKGDMLYLQPGTSTLIRSQGTYTGDEEITRIVEHLECDPCYATELIQLSASGGGTNEKSSFLETLRARDEVYEQAIEVVIREGRGSVSLLQRALGIGYGRAARLVDFMAEDGIVGDYNGSQAREVLYTTEQWNEVKRAG
jgi:S-DNA-T family DNA segregation ATPase FtsK/SpoIIIE